jgi:hypothetical protein
MGNTMAGLRTKPNLNTLPNIKRTENNNSVSIEMIIPEKDSQYTYFDYAAYSDAVVRAHAGVLMEALNKRAMNCAKKLQDNIGNILSNDGLVIAYKLESNNAVKHFSLPAYEAMQRGIDYLREDRYDDFLRDSAILIQAVKAIAVYDEPVRFKDELVSILMDELLRNK